MFTVNPVAEELGLVDAAGPGAVLALAAAVPPSVPSAQLTQAAPIPNTASTASAPIMTTTPSTAPRAVSPGPSDGVVPTTVDGDVQMSTAPSAPSPDKDADGLCDETEQLGPLEGQMRPESHFYAYLLDACEKLFEGEMDQANFEENMRFLFGTKVSCNFGLLFFVFVPSSVNPSKVLLRTRVAEVANDNVHTLLLVSLYLRHLGNMNYSCLLRCFIL